MTRFIALLIALAATPSFAAETWKWVDEKGVVTYGQKPPPGRNARPVDTTPQGAVGSPPAPPRESAQRGGEAAAGAAAAPRVSGLQAATPRGMDFETYIRLERGMTEGELLQRAGKPDHETVENFRHDIVKSYYYFPTPANPYTTVVTLRGGRIATIERVKKF